MTSESATPRLLFVVDNDFGALGTMMYFLHGQPLAARARLMLPRRLHGLHAGSLDVASDPYDTVADIHAAVDRDRPDLVLLASGYLLAFQELFAVKAVRALVRGLTARGCAVATTDPYLGTFRQVPAAFARTSGGNGVAGRARALLHRMRLELHVRRVAAVLEPLPHFYPVPMPDVPGAPHRYSFFNRRYMRTTAELESISANPGAIRGTRGGVRRWLFVLASFDLQLQERQHGKGRFDEVVAARLHDALEQGREPTFIGPPAFVQVLERRMGRNSGATLMAACAFREFEWRLLDAEAVFYWQLFSTSSFLRLWNGLPVLFFDEGHNARLLAPLREAGLAHYFMGRAPTCIDLEDRIDASAIAARAGEFREAARMALGKLETLPEPARMVEAILASR